MNKKLLITSGSTSPEKSVSHQTLLTCKKYGKSNRN